MRFGVSNTSDWSTFGSLHISHQAASGTLAAGCKPRRLSNGQSKSDEARKPLMAWCGRRIVARYFRRLATVQPHKASCRTNPCGHQVVFSCACQPRPCLCIGRRKTPRQLAITRPEAWGAQEGASLSVPGQRGGRKKRPSERVFDPDASAVLPRPQSRFRSVIALISST